MKFYLVGGTGIVVQVAVLWLLTRIGVHYLLATGLAVESAILNNYIWHVRWTWRDREDATGFGSLLRFHFVNGSISLLSNLVLMRTFTGWLGLPVVGANLIAIALTSVLNYLLGDRWVFARASDDKINHGSDRRGSYGQVVDFRGERVHAVRGKGILADQDN
jgi:putative flippase GtrA